MMRCIFYRFREAINTAALLMDKGFKGIEYRKSMPVGKDVSPAGEHQRLIFSDIIKGVVPVELPCLILLDDKGNPVAEFFIYK